MVAIYDVLKASKGIHVDDTFAELWGRKLSNAYTVETYTGTLPATLTGTKAGYLESYKIFGNTARDGTPTPENPIMPSGCGERTGNLWDENYENISTAMIYKSINVGNGSFTLSTNIPLGTGGCSLFLMPGQQSSGAATAIYGAYDGSPRTVTSVDGYVTLVYRIYDHKDPRDYQTMLNAGSTALPYEPYGYKLPLTVNGVEYPIYLGEAETTRKITMLVLTGEENFSKNTASSSSYLYFRVRNALLPNSIEKTPLICNELPVTNAAPISQIGINSNNVYNTVYVNFGADVMNAQPSGNTVEGLKEYLAAQYAAGTPVTIWYVLAEPETGIVNEPLMKIGDYADTIDSTQSTVQIPTAAGTTVIDYDGEPKPDRVELKYRKPKGQ